MTTFEQRLKDALSHTYDIERELGGGGMSRVFVATERSLGRKIVIKVLSPDLTADVNRGRFRREIQVAAQLQHPHIVTVFSAGEIDDLLYYTMPFISGESLKSALEKNGPLPVVEVVRVLYHVAEALDYAHSQGVVHRDIKPANILRSGAYSLVTDFGVAKALNASMASSGMTSTGMAVGTPAYMAPEQLAGDSAADHRIDIYALGLLAYELLYGKSPFAAATPQRVLAAVLTQEPTPLIEVRPDVPPSLSELVMACLSKEPEKRPASAKEVLDALDMFSTASGEIRTMEHKIPRSERMTPRTPIAVPAFPSEQTGTTEVSSSTQPVSTGTMSTGAITTGSMQTGSVQTGSAQTGAVETVATDHPSEEVPYVGYAQPKKSRTKSLAIAVLILVPIAAGAFLLLQRSGNAPTLATIGMAPAAAPAESVAATPAAITPVPESAAAVLTVKPDSQAVADSIKKAARRDSTRKAAAKAADSARKANLEKNAVMIDARDAAAALLSNPAARKSFVSGATHKGGLLGTKTLGDLQTQINALQPFLTKAGLTYEQFKSLVQESGVKLFDESGRMLPDAMQQFAGGH